MRYRLNPEFRRRIFAIALKREATEAQAGRSLGYQVAKGRRFRELRNGVTKTVALPQLERLSEITGISLDEILKNAEPVKGRASIRRRFLIDT